MISIQTILQKIDGISFVYLDQRDVVRHKLVRDIIDAYEKFENKKKYEDLFHHVERTYREKLRERIGTHSMMVAPDAPVTDRYWSNRVFMAMGFGAFMLHPYCAKLAEMYKDGEEIIF